LGTGVFIGAYTVWDGYAVQTLGAPPVLYLYLGEVGRLVLLAPLVLSRLSSGEPARTWRESRREAVGVAALSPLAYLLVLTAMSFTPVSLIAPVREVSILVAAARGAVLLREGFAGRRLAGAAGMGAEVVLQAQGEAGRAAPGARRVGLGQHGVAEAPRQGVELLEGHGVAGVLEREEPLDGRV